MADQCIVCLETLDVQQPSDPHNPSSSSVSAAPAGSAITTGDSSEPAASIEVDAVTPPKESDASNSNNNNNNNSPVSTTASNTGTTSRKHDNRHDHVAEIQVCGHALHDSCLRLWTDKANSCPICRQQFHLVHVYDKIGGELQVSPRNITVHAERSSIS